MRFTAIGLLILLGSVPAHAESSYVTSDVTIATTTGGVPQDIPARLLKPEGDGPFPAIVMLHDCSGLGPRSSGAPGRWSALLAGQGYVVIIPDSFTPRGFPQGVCTAPFGPQTNTVNPVPRAADALATLAFLRTLPYIDGKRIGVMGGSHGGTTTLAANIFNTGQPNGFAAAIAFYPGCGGRLGEWNVDRHPAPGPVTGYIGTYRPAAPLLILIGEKDDWTPAADCKVMAERAQAAGYPVTIKIYPGAYHAFDNNSSPRYIAERRNINKPDGRGATTGGDAAAWADSINEVKSFFARTLAR